MKEYFIKLWNSLFTKELEQHYYETDYVDNTETGEKYGVYVYKNSNIYDKILLSADWFKTLFDRKQYITKNKLLPLTYNCGCKGVTLYDAELVTDSLASSKHWKICKTCLKDKLDNGAIAII